MQRRITITALALAIAAAGLTSPTASATTAAPAAERGHTPKWTEADKTGFGTARTNRSRVWFTLQNGRVSEVFYPDLSTPSVQSLELLVTDGIKTDRQSRHMTSVVTRPDERSLRFTQVSTDNQGHYRVTEEFVTDPSHDALVVHIGVESLDGRPHGLQLRYAPALGNGTAGDQTHSRGHALRAVDRKAHVASTLVSSPALANPRDQRGIQTGLIPLAAMSSNTAW